MHLLIILYYILHKAVANVHNFHLPEENYYADFIKIGQTQYDMIQQRSALPKYGECWKNAVLHLTEDCKSLTEEKQQDLSLSFTNCFLEMSGHPIYSCVGDKKPNLRRICINSMSDRAFNVYTEFYSHTQNMCFYLYNRMWHEQAEETINLLNYNTIHVNKQLEQAKLLQSGLLEQQKKGLEIQNELMYQGQKLSDELQNSQMYVQRIADNFTTSTKAQTKLLFNIFSKINTLQSWALGEASWFSTAAYYISYVLIVLVISSTKVTEKCKLPLLLILTLNFVIEYVVISYISNFIQSAEVSHDYINISKTYARYICLLLCICILVRTILSYEDYNVSNNNLLLKLHQQSVLTMQKLEKLNTEHDQIMLLMKQLLSSQKIYESIIYSQSDIASKENIFNTPSIKTRSKNHEKAFAQKDLQSYAPVRQRKL